MPTSWPANLTDWAWRAWIGGGLLIAIGTMLAAWAIRGDRSRGRRRCPKCWYDLRGTPHLRCSECGHAAKSEKRLYRTRRRWRWATLACLLQFAGACLCLAPRMQRQGWPSLLPVWALLRLVSDEPGESPYLGSWVVFAPGSSPRFMRSHSISAELARRANARALSDSQWRYAFDRKEVIRSRERWPRQIPWAISLGCPIWLDECRIQFRCITGIEYNGSARSTPSVTREPVMRRPRIVGTLTKDAKEVVFDCNVSPFEWFSEGTSSKREFWRGPIRVSVEVVETLDEAVTPERSPQVTDAMRHALSLSVEPFPPACSLPCQNAELKVRLDRSRDPSLSEIAFGFAVDLLFGERVIQTVRLGPGVHAWNLEPLPENTALLTFDNAGDGSAAEGLATWTLRVRGDAEMALYDWDKPKYWSGAFTLPLTGESLGRSPRAR